MRPKPNIPKNIVAKVTVNTNLSFSVILCSSFIIKGRSVVFYSKDKLFIFFVFNFWFVHTTIISLTSELEYLFQFSLS